MVALPFVDATFALGVCGVAALAGSGLWGRCSAPSARRHRAHAVRRRATTGAPGGGRASPLLRRHRARCAPAWWSAASLTMVAGGCAKAAPPPRSYTNLPYFETQPAPRKRRAASARVAAFSSWLPRR